nr:Integrase, catalytic core [Ipomoea batatas]
MASEPPSPKSHQGKTSAEETNEKDDSRQQKGVGMMIDPMSPYYLHASDAPGQVYVAELLRDGNYGWLKSAMDKDIRGSVRFAITARDIWRDLEERFGKESAPRAFEIRRAVTLLRQDKATVSTYYTKLKSLWDEMNCTTPLPMCNCQGCKCNLSKKYAELREKEQLYDFLMGLDEEFNTVKSQILSTRPIPSLGVAYHMVSEDEQQRLISSRLNMEQR